MLLQPGRGDEAEGDGFHYHIGGVGSPEFPHDVAAVGFHCVYGDEHRFGNILGIHAFG